MGFLFQGLKMNFFFRSLSWVLKKKGGQVHGDGVQICIIGGSKQFFFLNIIYIYIYIILGQGVHLTITYHHPCR